MKTCNVCGKEFDEKELLTRTSEDGTEYFICSHCDTNGVKVTETVEFHICKQCGYPHEKKEFKGVCKFCEQTEDFATLNLTEVEADLLYEDPETLLTNTLGKDAASKIAKWKDSPESEKVETRHRRDRIIDTSFLIGIIASYFMLEFSMKNYINNKPVLYMLLSLTVLMLVTSPVIKSFDRKPRNKPLPLWLSFGILAVIAVIYILVFIYA